MLPRCEGTSAADFHAGLGIKRKKERKKRKRAPATDILQRVPTLYAITVK